MNFVDVFEMTTMKSSRFSIRQMMIAVLLTALGLVLSREEPLALGLIAFFWVLVGITLVVFVRPFNDPRSRWVTILLRLLAPVFIIFFLFVLVLLPIDPHL